MPSEMNLAYLSSIYPRATDTFVRSEVRELRQLGHRVHTFSIRRAEASQLVSDPIREEEARTTYIVSDHLLQTPLSALKLLVRSPCRFARALRLMGETCPPGFKAFVWQVAYFLEAAFLADSLIP